MKLFVAISPRCSLKALKAMDGEWAELLETDLSELISGGR